MINPYLLYLKLGIAVLVLGICAALAYKVHGWHRDALQLGAVRAEMADLKAAQEASHKASEGLQNELETLRTARKPSPVVRMCKPAKPVPQAGTGRDGSTPGAGELPQEVGPDIGPDLYGLADEADELAARLRACQALLK
jgi:hypothetical protein